MLAADQSTKSGNVEVQFLALKTCVTLLFTIKDLYEESTNEDERDGGDGQAKDVMFADVNRCHLT